MSRYGSYGGFPEYVSVAERREQAKKLAAKLTKQGRTLNPVVIEGRMIAKTFWGKSWCTNLESFSDYENRLPRGRTYARNGSVIDLKINPGEITAMVSGSRVYDVSIKIDTLPESKWKSLVKECSGGIESLIELLQGKFSKGVMEIITRKETGMFPKPKEIKLECSCPDYATMCKHVAAVLYGVGNRLDENPEALFILRQTNHMDLVDNTQLGVLPVGATETPFDGDLSALFGIDFAEDTAAEKLVKTKKEPRVKAISPNIVKEKILKAKTKIEEANPKPIKPKVTRKKKVT
ncbi:MAG: SWIM zinc finger family protein [Pseudomonadota bacterium]